MTTNQLNENQSNNILSLVLCLRGGKKKKKKASKKSKGSKKSMK